MDEKQEPQTLEGPPVVTVIEAKDTPEAGASARKGDWQGYDPTLLTALLDD